MFYEGYIYGFGEAIRIQWPVILIVRRFHIGTLAWVVMHAQIIY